MRNANTSILGRASGELRELVDLGMAEEVEDTAYGTGCASSLLAGLHTGEDCEALTLPPGDPPGVKPEFIDESLDAWRRERPRGSATHYRGSSGIRSSLSGRHSGS